MKFNKFCSSFIAERKGNSVLSVIIFVKNWCFSIVLLKNFSIDLLKEVKTSRKDHIDKYCFSLLRLRTFQIDQINEL